jgi:hypothetical protein
MVFLLFRRLSSACGKSVNGQRPSPTQTGRTSETEKELSQVECEGKPAPDIQIKETDSSTTHHCGHIGPTGTRVEAETFLPEKSTLPDDNDDGGWGLALP